MLRTTRWSSVRLLVWVVIVCGTLPRLLEASDYLSTLEISTVISKDCASGDGAGGWCELRHRAFQYVVRAVAEPRSATGCNAPCRDFAQRCRAVVCVTAVKPFSRPSSVARVVCRRPYALKSALWASCAASCESARAACVRNCWFGWYCPVQTAFGLDWASTVRGTCVAAPPCNATAATRSASLLPS